VESGAYIREHFFGPDPRLRRLVEHLSDDDLRKLPRGGHDYRKLYAAYKAAVEHEGSPTVILAHTIKGWTLGPEFEARNATHQIKKMTEAELKTFRDRLFLDIPDKVLEEGDPPYYHPGPKSEELEYMRARRRALDGAVPERVVRKASLPPVAGDPFKDLLSGTGEKVKASTTSAFTRLLRNLTKDRSIGRRVVPIIPDEGRTFGLDALFSQAKIYAPFGQKYEPVDAQLVLSYREDRTGQILEEGITEAGSMASFTAAGTAYATWGEPMIPFFIFYSMFGFQRVGDLIWAFGDARGRGFLLGATAGRTTLQGEGLQHDDGHSPVLASTVPNCRVYDPAFAYEVAVIIEDGLRRMYGEKPEDCFYYITLYNEMISMPAMPPGSKDGILRGLYRYKPAPTGLTNRVRILASGTGMLAALEAQELLAAHHDTAAEVWSATSYKLLREDALSVERFNRLHPTDVPRVPYISHVLGANGGGGPTVAVTDYMKAVPDQVARWVPGPFIPLGTDGYGFSDTRSALRRHFETDAPHIVVAALSGLAELGDVKGEAVAEAIRRYDLDPELADPREA
jgi:pyruvate dehydrogenase E1 component